MTYHGLKVDLWVPVAIVEDDDVGGAEIDSQAASACRQHEDELARVRRVVLINRRLSPRCKYIVSIVP